MILQFYLSKFSCKMVVMKAKFFRLRSLARDISGNNASNYDFYGVLKIIALIISLLYSIIFFMKIMY